MKEAIIFDVDGVIVDSEPIRYETYRQLFKNEYSINISGEMNNKIIGMAQKETLAHFLTAYNLKGNVKELIQKRAILLKEAFSKKENIKPIPGLFNLLKRLQSYKIQLAIVSSSNKDYVNNILNRLDLNDIFDFIITGDMVTKGKPDPEIFLLAAEKLGKKKEECIVIEDSLNGISAAKAADMKVIAITSSFSREQLSSADMIVDDLNQIKVQDIQNI